MFAASTHSFYRIRHVIIIAALCVMAPPAAAQVALTVTTWNVESGGSEVKTLTSRLGSAVGVDLWGLTEVSGRWAAPFERAAAIGEGAPFKSLLGRSGGADRLAILFDVKRFELLSWFEIPVVNVGGNVRAPIVARFRDRESNVEFLFMVNHLYRSDEAARHRQARLLNTWIAGQKLPVIAVGDYNFDWDVRSNGKSRDRGYDLLTAEGRYRWVRPRRLLSTQCSRVGDGEDARCRYNSILDFVFVGGPALEWPAQSWIIQHPGDFPDTDETSDHRMVKATFTLPSASPPLTPVERWQHKLREVSEWLEETYDDFVRYIDSWF